MIFNLFYGYREPTFAIQNLLSLVESIVFFLYQLHVGAFEKEQQSYYGDFYREEKPCYRVNRAPEATVRNQLTHLENVKVF